MSQPTFDSLEDEIYPKRPTRTISGTQVTFAIILAIGLMLAINFSSRVAADRELRQVRDAVDREIATLKREQGDLVNRLGYVQSDAFVEEWARSEGRMVREGEVLIVPFPSTNQPIITATPESSSDIVIPLEPQTQSWELWWAMFFDSPPPKF